MPDAEPPTRPDSPGDGVEALAEELVEELAAELADDGRSALPDELVADLAALVEADREARRGMLPTPEDLQVVRDFDDAVDRAFDRLRGRQPLDRVVYAVTELGDFGLIWLLLGAAKATRNDRNFDRGVRLFGVMAAESVLMNGMVKSLFKRERPVYQGERPHKLRIPRTTSFPSGHASSAFLAAALLSEENPRLRRAYYGLALFVSASRVHVRIHHASDVLSGAVVGAGLGVIAKALWPLDRPPRGTAWLLPRPNGRRAAR